MAGSQALRTAIAVFAALALTNAALAQSTDAKVTKVYSLSHVKDAKLGPWLAETAPEIIQPESWKRHGGVIRFNASSQLLVVHHVPAVQAQIETLVRGVATAAARGDSGGAGGIAQAQFSEPAPLPPAQPLPGKNTYPIPAPLSQPKHLFHFVIRYEGDGVISVPLAAPPIVPQALAQAVAPAKAEEGDKTEILPERSNQLFNVILRYEGDGIVDENIVALVKLFQALELPGGCGSLPAALPPASSRESCPLLSPLSIETAPSVRPETGVPAPPPFPGHRIDRVGTRGLEGSVTEAPLRPIDATPELLPAPQRVSPMTNR